MIDKLTEEFKARDPNGKNPVKAVNMHLSTEIGKEWKGLTEQQKSVFKIDAET